MLQQQRAVHTQDEIPFAAFPPAIDLLQSHVSESSLRNEGNWHARRPGFSANTCTLMVSLLRDVLGIVV